VVALQQDLVAAAHAHELMPQLVESRVTIGAQQADRQHSDK